MRRMSVLVWLTAVTAPMLLEAAPVAIVAFGDSTTARRGKLRVYPQVLREELPAKGLPATVLNAGVSGHTTAMGRARFDRDVLARKPEIVIVQFGLNDSAVDVRKGATKPRLPLAAYDKNLRYFVQTLRARGTRSILMTPNPRRWTARMKQLYGKPPYKVAEVQGFNVLLTDYVAAVRKVASEERVPLVDVFDVFETYGKVKGQAVDDLLLDGLHPNDKGHRIIADLLMAQILKLTKGRKSTGRTAPPGTTRAVFVEAGVAKLLAREAGDWKRGKGYLEARGTDKTLWAGKAIGKGDFHVRATLAIHNLKRSAAAFRMGDSYFGFEGAHGKVFLTGPLFKARGKPIGEPTDFMTDGKPFVFEVVRSGRRLEFRIDGKVAHAMIATDGALGPMAFLPWRSTMRVSDFSAEGSLEEPKLPREPDPVWVSPRFRDVSHRTDYPGVLGTNLAALGDGSVMTVLSVGPQSYRAPLGSNWLVYRVTRDEGKTWSKEARIVNHPDCNAAHPSALRTRDGAIHVFYLGFVRHSWKDGNPTPEEKSDVWTVSSRDGGRTWSKPKMIHECYCGATNGAIETRDGRIVFPFEHYVANPGRCVSRAAVSADGGKTWKISSPIDIGGAGDHAGALEPSAIELKDGRLWMLIRTQRGQFWESFSEDSGLTWSAAKPTKIESAHAPGHLARLASGQLALVWNRRPKARRELYVALSDDDGKTWGKPVLVARGTQVTYPFVFERKPGTLWLGFLDVHRGWARPRPRTVSIGEKALLAAAAGEPIVIEKEGVTRIQLLPPGPGNPRNSEGDFVQLKDGRILFVYTHFTGGGGDHSKAHLAGRFSSDGGRTWTKEDVVVVPNEGTWNIMSVSLLRLRSGAIAMFYLRKNAIDDCRPYMRTSTDEARTWSEPTLCVPPGGYYVLNNDRVVQLESGRLVAPVSRHTAPGGKFDGHGVVSCFLSDDDGRTWRQSRSQLTGKTPKRHVVLQEPGVVELKDSRLMMFMRTTAGCQYLSFSNDGGDTWTPAAPSKLIGPCSPASIERIPKTGDLLVVWNDHSTIDAALRGKRTPFNVAISRDEGKAWEKVKTLEDDPGGWYCYTAIEFVGDRILLGHCAGQRATGGLNLTQITLFDVAGLYR